MIRLNLFLMIIPMVRVCCFGGSESSRRVEDLVSFEREPGASVFSMRNLSRKAMEEFDMEYLAMSLTILPCFRRELTSELLAHQE